MKTYLKILISIIALLFATNQSIAQDVTKVHRDSLEIVVKKYYDLNLKTFQANSTIKDIDRIFELFTDSFTYIHPKYGGTYTREDLYNGYVRNQKNGGYNGEVTDIKVLNKIVGLNAVVVERIYMEKEGDGIKEGEARMTLFEFEKGKISRIFEYW
ncbi:nuclear transport factor 2 family protein [Aquimarina sp. AU474]|uniref:nuclear transport factor 2 family protein n=1 Tax=Aquimarina sp. AU474 TaxID=2108529 RepID=UPI000D695124|nr:nuclear transport factor 2 family protein [Aquimarina sp. AU474]